MLKWSFFFPFPFCPLGFFLLDGRASGVFFFVFFWWILAPWDGPTVIISVQAGTGFHVFLR